MKVICMLCRIKSYGSYGWYTYKQELEENREKLKWENMDFLKCF